MLYSTIFIFLLNSILAYVYFYFHLERIYNELSRIHKEKLNNTNLSNSIIVDIEFLLISKNDELDNYKNSLFISLIAIIINSLLLLTITLYWILFK